MVSPILATEPWKLVERHDERQTYLQYKDEKFLKPLFQVAKKLIDAPVTPTQEKKQYIDAIEDINAQYFAAQDTKTATRGQFHKYDDTAEEHLRDIVAEEVSRSIGELRTLLDAHTTVIEIATTQLAKRHDDSQTQQDALNTFEQTVSTCTMRAVCDGWLPTLELYYFSLNPGERAVEGRERREQRLYGTEDTDGVVDRLARSKLKQVTPPDLTKLQQIDTYSRVNGHSVIHKLQTKFDWAVSS